MKIYIIGPCGSGKTYFSKKLSEKYNIKCFELDKVCWDDENGNIKRTDEESLNLFNEILKNDSWIIEDVGRAKFEEGRVQADIIYYIKMKKLKAYYRVLKRWIKQRIGIEVYNHPPTLKQIKYFLSVVNSYYKGEKQKIKKLERYNNKVYFINKGIINKMLREKKGENYEKK